MSSNYLKPCFYKALSFILVIVLAVCFMPVTNSFADENDDADIQQHITDTLNGIAEDPNASQGLEEIALSNLCKLKIVQDNYFRYFYVSSDTTGEYFSYVGLLVQAKGGNDLLKGSMAIKYDLTFDFSTTDDVQSCAPTGYLLTDIAKSALESAGIPNDKFNIIANPNSGYLVDHVTIKSFKTITPTSAGMIAYKPVMAAQKSSINSSDKSKITTVFTSENEFGSDGEIVGSFLFKVPRAFSGLNNDTLLIPTILDNISVVPEDASLEDDAADFLEAINEEYLGVDRTDIFSESERKEILNTEGQYPNPEDNIEWDSWAGELDYATTENYDYTEFENSSWIPHKIISRGLRDDDISFKLAYDTTPIESSLQGLYYYDLDKITTDSTATGNNVKSSTCEVVNGKVRMKIELKSGNIKWYEFPGSRTFKLISEEKHKSSGEYDEIEYKEEGGKKITETSHFDKDGKETSRETNINEGGVSKTTTEKLDADGNVESSTIREAKDLGSGAYKTTEKEYTGGDPETGVLKKSTSEEYDENHNLVAQRTEIYDEDGKITRICDCNSKEHDPDKELMVDIEKQDGALKIEAGRRRAGYEFDGKISEITKAALTKDITGYAICLNLSDSSKDKINALKNEFKNVTFKLNGEKLFALCSNGSPKYATAKHNSDDSLKNVTLEDVRAEAAVCDSEIIPTNDINRSGKFDLADVAAILKLYNWNKTTLSESESKIAWLSDVTEDYQIDIEDVNKVLKELLKL